MGKYLDDVAILKYDVDIICAAKDSACTDILKNFLISFKKDYRAEHFQKKIDGQIVLSNSSVFIFFNNPEIDGDISTTLDTVCPNEYLIMIIIVTHGPKDDIRCIPSFTFPSKVRMWCSIWGDEDKTCPNTEENISANIMLECFLKMINNRCNEMRNIQCGEELMCTDHAESRVDKKIQLMETERDLTNESFDGVDNAVLVVCSEISEPYFRSFSNFMEAKIGVSTRLNKGSKRTPDLALCLKHDGTREEIQELYRVTGRPMTLIMITACEFDVQLKPLNPSIDGDISLNAVRLRYSETSDTLYDCVENKEAGEILKTKFKKHSAAANLWRWMKESVEQFLDSSDGPKKEVNLQENDCSQVENSQDSSHGPKKEVNLQENDCSQGEQMNPSADPFVLPLDDLVILCNRKVEICKPILMNFKTLYSIPNEFQWVSNAKDVMNVKKRVLICLHISRLADDIVDAIQMVDLSDAETMFLTIIHIAEPGLQVDTAFSSKDSRIVDVAHIVYSESYGCYVCTENNIAKSKFLSWITS